MNIQDKLRLFYDNPVISCHEHVWAKGEAKELDIAGLENTIQIMETLHVERIVVSLPYTVNAPCPPEVFRHHNNLVAEAIKRYPDKLHGMVYVDPAFEKEALYEVDRCVQELGFRGGVKLYHQQLMNDPKQYPLIEKCIELDIPMTMHCAHLMDPETKARQPRCSDGAHMADAARRYPEATFVMAHIGGGGDWKYSIKAIKDTPNVLTDTGGSIHDTNMIEEAVELLGAERILFATDGGWSSTVGKILGAEIPEGDKITILSGNRFRKFLER